jgi:hypothetical protein
MAGVQVATGWMRRQQALKRATGSIYEVTSNKGKVFTLVDSGSDSDSDADIVIDSDSDSDSGPTFKRKRVVSDSDSDSDLPSSKRKRFVLSPVSGTIKRYTKTIVKKAAARSLLTNKAFVVFVNNPEAEDESKQIIKNIVTVAADTTSSELLSIIRSSIPIGIKQVGYWNKQYLSNGKKVDAEDIDNPYIVDLKDLDINTLPDILFATTKTGKWKVPKKGTEFYEQVKTIDDIPTVAPISERETRRIQSIAEMEHVKS